MALKRNKRVADVAERLLETAEHLYGQHGIEGVSLRQIGVTAGTGNNYAVQYHFGDRAGLIKAVLAKRQAAIFANYSARLERAETEGRLGDTRTLVELLLLPLIDIRDEQGKRPHARFVFALLSSQSGLEYSFEIFGSFVSSPLFQMFARANSHVPPLILGERLRLASVMTLSSVFHRALQTSSEDRDAALLDDVLDASAAAISAPVRPSVRELASSGCLDSCLKFDSAP